LVVLFDDDFRAVTLFFAPDRFADDFRAGDFFALVGLSKGASNHVIAAPLINESVPYQHARGPAHCNDASRGSEARALTQATLGGCLAHAVPSAPTQGAARSC
jgi:hypothetical protein